MKKTAVILLVALLANGCSSGVKTTSKKQKSDKNIFQMQEKRQKILAPGTALIVATLIKKDKEVCTIKVDEILHYGHSTPRITKYAELKVNVQNDKLKNKLFENKKYKILLRSNSPKGEPAGLIPWEIVNVE